MDSGYSRNWEPRLIRNLDARDDLKRVFSNADATIFALRDQTGKAPAPDPGPIGPQVTWTPWSVVGGLAAIALIVLLGTREVVRVAVRPGVRQLHAAPEQLLVQPAHAGAVAGVVGTALLDDGLAIAP